MNEPEPGAVTNDGGNPQGIELRGYEIAHKAKAGGWVQDAKFRPNKYGWNEAVTEVKRLCESYPNETYRIRPIISLEPNAAAIQNSEPTPAVATGESAKSEPKEVPTNV